MNNLKFIDGIGFIPNDWAVKRADELCSKITKGTTPPKEDIVNNSNIPFLRVNNLTFDGLLDVNSSFIFVSEVAHRSVLSRSIAYKNDILMNIVGPPLGKTALLNDSFDEYNLNQAIVIYRVSSTDVARLFFFFFLKGVIAQNWLQSHSKKTSGQQNLTIEVCKNLPVPIPPLPEQIKIAEILSTWDNAINTVQKLFANSQQQKKALMQQLLTGKKRFAGFAGEWRKIQLKNLGECIRGVSYKPEDLLGSESVNSVRLLRSTNIQNGYLNDNDITIVPKENVRTEQILAYGDLVICMANGSKLLVGKSAFFKDDNKKYTIGAFCAAFRAEEKQQQLFIKYLFESEKYSEQLIVSLSGSSINNLKSSDIEGLQFYIPIAIDEQQKIAAILTTADQEIDNLRAQLNHLKQEKKALMQQLLTGKRRVATSQI